ncbi:alpha/beta-hydrolase [Sistotremastrum niveocremeum HHB9708]|uniref:Alpha/beta-hydrolase n=2 Tax=Sistotremastraceae TaxID=3402574 RepID=A0A164VFF4_9AGAM|nr:alpha/beta-hydrolase [Sistotremastrum niveocremeum HHB9708]KZT35583.1 alpha/beta-hydrolase [Sistotremastrum suecicum HHB10207 ss-3]
MENLKPYQVNVPESDIVALKAKLSATRFPDELEGAKWDYGVPLADMKRLVHYWEHHYDWRKYEDYINKTFAQFGTDIEVAGHGSLNIHFVHQKSTVKNAIPLLFSHGWPGHFMEAAKIIPLLSNPPPGSPAFHVVAWSLPGFGFSDAPRKPGFNLSKMAEAGHNLMMALGYNEYVVQGGDWGSDISWHIGRLYGGKHCKSVHLNFIDVPSIQFTENPILWIQDIITPLSDSDRKMITRVQEVQDKGKGYHRQQSSQPQTVSYGLADSPVGLLAWIYEKLHNWTDSYPFTDDDILNWISIYWFSKAGPAASLRIYYEDARTNPVENKKLTPLNFVPIGFSSFPKEIYCVSKTTRRLIGNLVYETTHDSGGHFAAYENPEALAHDLRTFYGTGGKAFGVVKNCSGYTAT